MTSPSLPPSDPFPFPGLRRELGRFARLALKELREILRDRRTILTLVLMPILLYPLLSIAFQKLLLTRMEAERPTAFVIGMREDQSEVLLRCLRLGIESWRRSDEAWRRKKQTPPKLEFYQTEQLERAVREYQIDLGLRLRDSHEPRAGANGDLEFDIDLIYAEGSATGLKAYEFISKQLQAASEDLLRARLQALHVTQRVMPLETSAVPLRNLEVGEGTISLASLIPVILILMTITGAVYPAIDLTAGERERGTLETLVAAPVPRLGLLFAKYISVVTVAFLTAAVNLVSMTITILAGGLGSTIWGEKGLALSTVLEIFALLLLFSAFFSAVLLTLTSFARSFKEAQAYLIPLMMFSISPGLVSLIPGIKLSGWVLITPLLNIALLSRDLLEGNAEPVSAVIVVFSTILFAMAAIALAAHHFGSESVLYDSQSGWADLFRRVTSPQPVPAVWRALLVLALMFPACFLLTNSIAQLDEISIGMRLVYTSAGTALIFGIIPALAAMQGRVCWSTGFHFHSPPLFSLPLAVLLGFSLWPFAFELTIAMHEIGFSTISTSHSSQVQGLIEQFRTLSPVTVVLALAVVPAVFEEFFFRGFLFSALLSRMRPAPAILASAAFFGLFHLITTDALAVERLVPTTFLGLALGWVCWRTQSVFPGMLLHCCHNGFLTLVAFYERQLTAWGWGGAETKHLPWSWLLAGAVGSILGIALLQVVCPAPETGPKSDHSAAPSRRVGPPLH